MDKQTRFGFGATCALAIFGVLYPVIPWPWNVIGVGLCAVGVAYGFWPTVADILEGLFSFPHTQWAIRFSSLPLKRAATIVYEELERAGVHRAMDRANLSAKERIGHIQYALLTGAKPIYSITPPSTRLHELSDGEISELHPLPGTDYLQSDFATNRALSHGTRVSRSGLKAYRAYTKKVHAANI